MNHIDLDVLVKMSVRAAVHAVGTVNGVGVDTLGFKSAKVFVDAPTFAASATLDVALQEAAADTGYVAALDNADTPAALAFSQKTAAGIWVADLRLDQLKRWLRLVSVVGTDAVTHAAGFILMGPDDTKIVTASITPEFQL